MASQIAMLMLLFVGICLSFHSSEAHTLDVGGKDGWVIHPSEDYSHWSSRLRFSVNDTLYFKYKKGEDSVLVVNREEYDKCNTRNPIRKMGSGSSYFKFPRSGPFYFISGVKENCEKGQRLVIVVLSEHHRSHAPSPASIPPTTSPSHSPVPAPASSSPKVSPVPAPASSSPKVSPVPAPSPAIPSPKVSPVPVPASPSPKVSPVPAPASPSPKVSPVPIPASPSPKVSPSSAPASPSPVSRSPIVSPPSSSPSPKVSPVPASPKVSPTPAPASSSPKVSPTPPPESPKESPAMEPAVAPATDEQSPAPAPAKNTASKRLIPVTVAVIACSFVVIYSL